MTSNTQGSMTAANNVITETVNKGRVEPATRRKQGQKDPREPTSEYHIETVCRNRSDHQGWIAVWSVKWRKVQKKKM